VEAGVLYPSLWACFLEGAHDEPGVPGESPADADASDALQCLSDGSGLGES